LPIIDFFKEKTIEISISKNGNPSFFTGKKADHQSMNQLSLFESPDKVTYLIQPYQYNHEASHFF
jgi:hypothetical protein